MKADNRVFSIETMTESSCSYIGLANRRLRTLRKRLAKIEKYEDDLKTGSKEKFNEDQLQAVEKKGEVLSLIKEMEELIKNMEDKYAEEEKNARKTRKLQLTEQIKLRESLINDERSKFENGMMKLVNLFYACNIATSQVPSSLVSKAQKDQIMSLFSGIVGSDTIELSRESIENSFVKAKDYIDSQNEHVLNSVDALLGYLLTPTPEPVFTVNDSSNQHPISAQDENVLDDVVVLASVSGIPVEKSLSFMTPSFVLEDPAIISAGASTSYHPPETIENHVIQPLDFVESTELKTADNEIESQQAKKDHYDERHRSNSKSRKGGRGGGINGRGNVRGRGSSRGGNGSFRGGPKKEHSNENEKEVRPQKPRQPRKEQVQNV